MADGSPTDPSQVNVEFSTTDLVVGTGPEAVAGNRATLNFDCGFTIRRVQQARARGSKARLTRIRKPLEL